MNNMKRVALFCILLTPFFYLLLELFLFKTVIDPIKYIYTITGVAAIVVLFFTTFISIIKTKINFIKYRRMIGLFGFFYVFLHFLNFFVLDAQLDFNFVVEESIDKPFIYLGMLSFFMLLFMAITSTKNLYRKYNGYHKVLYIVLVFITIHFIMAQKSLSINQYIYILIIFIIAILKIKQLIYNKK